MRKYIILFLLLLIALTIGCENDTNVIVPTKCVTQDLGITAQDSVLPDLFQFGDNIKWNGTFSNSFVSVQYSRLVSIHAETNTYGFKFKKNEDCLELEYGYIGFFSWDYPNTVSEININYFNLQEWKKDSLLAGEVSYNLGGPDNYTRRFWVEFDTEDEYEEIDSFNDWADLNLPLYLDINNDSGYDYVLDFSVEELSDPILTKKYTLSFNSLNQNNSILALSSDSGIFVNSSFSSEDGVPSNEAQRDFLIYKVFPDNLDVFNEWSYTSYVISLLELTRFILLKMSINGQEHYCWVKIKLDTMNNSVEILDTYFHPVPNEHITTP